MLQFNKVCFSYPSADYKIFTELKLDFAPGWTGLVGANGSGKTTLMQLASGALKPDSGTVTQTGLLAYCPQRTEQPGVSEKSLFDPYSWSAEKDRLYSQLEIEQDWLKRWDTLSQGEQKRTQIAAAISLNPDILLVDEPTNHLDSYSTELIYQALKKFTGIGLLISHNRQLLDDLCTRIVYLDPPDCLILNGNYSQAIEQKETAEISQIHQREVLKKKVKHLEKELIRRSQEAGKSHKRFSKKHIGRKDSDSRAKINLAKLTGKDTSAGKQASTMGRRVDNLNSKLDNTRFKKRYKLDFRLTGEKCTRNSLLSISAQNLAMGPEKHLILPDLIIAPEDRIGITGPNGVGKSTLIRFLLSELNLSTDKAIYIPQEISIKESKAIMNKVAELPSDQLGELMSFISCLGSIPSRLKATDMPSPGEIRKLCLALGLLNKPWLIIMDEPTNHLDLPAIELLESALENVESSLILVSHDRQFLNNLINKELQINRLESGNSRAFLT